MNDRLWHYQARIVRVVDGDTVIAELDTGFHSTRWERLRLLAVDCPEVVGGQRAAGLAAALFTDGWVQSHAKGYLWPFIVTTIKTDSFGRYLATIVSRDDGVSLADALLEAGHGVKA